jgi:tetratricopeptide (TPR) repeat protein
MSRSALSRSTVALLAALALPASAGWVNPPVIVPMPQRDPCGGFADDWSQHCRRDANGNMIDTRTGDVYDRNGNLIRRGTGRLAPSTAPAAAPKRGSAAGQTCEGSASTLDGLQRRGISLHQAGQWQAATACYERALKASPREPTVHMNLGLIDYEQGRRQDAMQRWQAALEGLKALPADQPAVRSVRGEALFAIAAAESARGDKARARDLARQALQMEPRLADAKYLRANLWGARLMADAQGMQPATLRAAP